MAFKFMKPGRRYFLINIDEPYAPDLFEVLKRGQMAKGDWPEGDIDFAEWKRQTFGCLECPDYRYTRSGGPPRCIALVQRGKHELVAGQELVIEEMDDQRRFVFVRPPEGWICPKDRGFNPLPLPVVGEDSE